MLWLRVVVRIEFIYINFSFLSFNVILRKLSTLLSLAKVFHC